MEVAATVDTVADSVVAVSSVPLTAPADEPAVGVLVVTGSDVSDVSNVALGDVTEAGAVVVSSTTVDRTVSVENDVACAGDSEAEDGLVAEPAELAVGVGEDVELAGLVGDVVRATDSEAVVTSSVERTDVDDVSTVSGVVWPCAADDSDCRLVEPADVSPNVCDVAVSDVPDDDEPAVVDPNDAPVVGDVAVSSVELDESTDVAEKVIADAELVDDVADAVDADVAVEVLVPVTLVGGAVDDSC